MANLESCPTASFDRKRLRAVYTGNFCCDFKRDFAARIAAKIARGSAPVVVLSYFSSLITLLHAFF